MTHDKRKKKRNLVVAETYSMSHFIGLQLGFPKAPIPPEFFLSITPVC